MSDYALELYLERSHEMSMDAGPSLAGVLADLGIAVHPAVGVREFQRRFRRRAFLRDCVRFGLPMLVVAVVMVLAGGWCAVKLWPHVSPLGNFWGEAAAFAEIAAVSITCIGMVAVVTFPGFLRHTWEEEYSWQSNIARSQHSHWLYDRKDASGKTVCCQLPALAGVKADAISRVLPRAVFSVEYFHDDPFLEVVHDGLSYYVDHWDEPSFQET